MSSLLILVTTGAPELIAFIPPATKHTDLAWCGGWVGGIPVDEMKSSRDIRPSKDFLDNLWSIIQFSV